jgi:hypothetical protein
LDEQDDEYQALKTKDLSITLLYPYFDQNQKMSNDSTFKNEIPTIQNFISEKIKKVLLKEGNKVSYSVVSFSSEMKG